MNLKIAEYPERYFAGTQYQGGVQTSSGDTLHIPKIWQTFFHQILPQIKNITDVPHFIGLEIYPEDFIQTRRFDYYAMVETKELVQLPNIVSKTVPSGKYISFEIEFDRITDEIMLCYDYLNQHRIPYDMTFDFEDYINDQNYTLKNQKLYFSIRLV